MHFLLLYDVVDDYVDRRGPFRAEHLSLIQKAHDRGELVMAGALADPPDGAVLVFRGPSPQHAESFAAADPYVRNGLVKAWRVRQWNTVIGDGATFPKIQMTRSSTALFTPFSIKGLTLPNRVVMAPMTRSFSPGGVPGEDVAAYYRRRAEGGVGLIITEGTYPPHPSAGFDPKVPHLYGEAALKGWRNVVDHVHAAGGHIFSQIWHVGMQVSSGPAPLEGRHPVGPSGEYAMTQSDIDAAVQAYAQAARSAQEAGFDGVELHGAHGYLIDQFFWEKTNQRTDAYGGDLVARTRFAADAIREVRQRVGPEFPVALRISQWKIGDYEAKLAKTPDELDQFLRPLVEAGVDIFHCSQRRLGDPEFKGSDLNLAGWTKKLTGKPTITVGSVTLGADFTRSFGSPESSPVTGIDELLDRLDRGEFDLVAVGRALIANPEWAAKVKAGALVDLRPFDRSLLASLV